jgi:hypothetical protein
MISNTTKVHLHFYQFLSFPYVSHSNLLFLLTNLYFTAGQSRLEKEMGTLSFIYFFTTNNIVIGLFLRVFLHLFKEYSLSPEECPGSPCLIYGSCAFTTFYYYNLMIRNQDSTLNIFFWTVKVKLIPWALTFAQFFIFFIFFRDLVDYFLDSVVGLFMVFLRKG